MEIFPSSKLQICIYPVLYCLDIEVWGALNIGLKQCL